MKPSRKIQPSTFLFCEYSSGGSFQSRLREVVERLAPMVGFNIRVTERAGTTLGSMLSNKNVGSKLECGRVECRVCCQADDKRQDCVRRNILYESECVKCVPSEERNDLSLERK